MHWSNSYSMLNKKSNCGLELGWNELTHNLFDVTCKDCLPCEHAMNFLKITRDIARDNFCSVEQIHCHCCSSVWEIK